MWTNFLKDVSLILSINLQPAMENKYVGAKYATNDAMSRTRNSSAQNLDPF